VVLKEELMLELEGLEEEIEAAEAISAPAAAVAAPQQAAPPTSVFNFPSVPNTQVKVRILMQTYRLRYIYIYC
jgi:hypothetical protein